LGKASRTPDNSGLLQISLCWSAISIWEQSDCREVLEGQRKLFMFAGKVLIECWSVSIHLYGYSEWMKGYFCVLEVYYPCPVLQGFFVLARFFGVKPGYFL
jgi:hypothetical protein